MLPQKICENCLQYVNDWYKFRRKCMKIDTLLKKFVTDQPQTNIENEKFKYCNVDFDDDRFNVIEPGPAEVNNSEMEQTEEPVLTDLDQCSNTNYLKDVTLEETAKKPLLKAPMKKFKCTFCPDSFYYLKDLQKHKLLIHKQTEKVVKKTQQVVDGDINLTGVNLRTRYEMKCCGKYFFTKARFRRHYNKKHPGEKPFMCETCGKKDFMSEETLKRHKILHTGKYRCDICSKTFTCNAILIIHKRDKHENDKPFICDVCGKRFVTELLMNYHKRFHTGEKKYVCEECGLAVVTSSSLAKHKRIHSNVKPHVCHVCGKGFIIKGRLVEHLRVHTGERPYSCHICNKGFTMKDKLKRHIRIHSGEKLFSCEYCGNNYSTSYGLTVHLKSHAVRNY